MPVLRATAEGGLDNAPHWCELKRYSIVNLGAGETYTWDATTKSNKLVVAIGAAGVTGETLAADGHSVTAGETFDVATGTYTVTANEASTVVVLGGEWGAVCGGSGVFRVDRSDQPDERGDPADYPKNTAFDRHYHDCDEYWILIQGGGRASSENILHDIGPGDCVATRMGNHHDLAWVDEPVLGVFFETTMRGQGRRGHLWEHTHGPADPLPS